jgi:NTP pyrophosphatase (non-canonical NTP hydrolase)
MTSDEPTFKDTGARIRQFVVERDWAKFHSPRDLAVGISVEAGELLEHFQWTQDAGESTLTEPKVRRAVAEEIADVAMYCFLLCDRLGLSLPEIIDEKLEINRRKYPVEKARGKALKYDKL